MCKVLVNAEILPSWFYMLSLMLMKILKPCTVATQNSAVRFVNASHWTFSRKRVFFLRWTSPTMCRDYQNSYMVQNLHLVQSLSCRNL